MSNLNDNRGIVSLQVVGLTTAELALAPAVDYIHNPERFEFFDTTDNTKRYHINPSGQFQLTASVPITIVGVPGSGNTLVATLAAGWTVSGWQWTRDGTPIVAATSVSYLLLQGDAGHVIGVLPSNLTYTPPGVLVSNTGVTGVWNDALTWNDSLIWAD